jgi:DNA repair protein RecO (recombination protein O)
MPLVETEAIVLRTYRLGEADRIASLLTRQLGKVRAVAAGAQRPKGRFGSALESLSYVRVWVFDRENRDLQRLNSAEVIESFFEMQKEYRIQVAGQYVAEVSEQFLPEREVNERVFRLLLAVLRAVKGANEVERPLIYFDYWVLRLGGLLPDVEHCAGCRRRLADELSYYGPGSVGMVCKDCRASGMKQSVSPHARSLASSLRSRRLEEWIRSEPASPGSGDLRELFEELIEGHLERKLITRPILAEALSPV